MDTLENKDLTTPNLEPSNNETSPQEETTAAVQTENDAPQTDAVLVVEKTETALVPTAETPQAPAEAAPAVDDELIVAEEEDADDDDTDDDAVDSEAVVAVEYSHLSREELIEELRRLMEKPIAEAKTAVEELKVAFYKKSHNHKVETPVADEVKEATDEAVEEPKADPIEVEFKTLLAKFREKKATAHAALEAEREKNLKEKLDILDKLEALTASTDDLSATIPAFRKLQQEWKAIDQVPQAKINEIWKTYSLYQEKFYDLIKINNDLREYDFKKNLELKTALCVAAESLESETDPVSAFHTLQKLHEEWREIGPVAREEREAVWTRFKEASSTINKKHQAYFESLKEEETKNLEAKTALCEKIETIKVEELKTTRQWEDASAQIIAMQEEWKKIGLAPRKVNGKIFRRFRGNCDAFFKAKNVFFKVIKEEQQANYNKKLALCELAESLKESTEWKETADKLIGVQKEWKTIGAVPRRHADEVWKRFVAACDYFFEQRDKNGGGRGVEHENMQKKQQVIEKFNAFEPSGNTSDDMNALKALVEEYNGIGFVPFKEKDKIYKAFKKASDAKFDEVRGARSGTREFHGGGGSGSGNSERNKLMKQFETLKNEITTYENNIGFLTASSKKGNALVDQMVDKIEKLKEQLHALIQKIDAIDQQ